jgi:competence protein ComEA
MNPRIIAARSNFDDQVMSRLQRLADQWRPAAPSEVGLDPSEAVEPVLDAAWGAVSAPGGVSAPAPPGFLTRLDRRSLRAVLALVCAAGLIAGWMWWQGRPRAVAMAPTLTASGTPMAGADPAAGIGGGDVVVHVLGAVRKPGLLRLPAGARVDDAIKAAGGVKTQKALASVNLARALVDGEQILVSAGGAPAGGQGAGSSPGVGLNSASASEFEALPGVGPVLAQRIVDWRTANGSFRSIDELGEVSGIGDSILEQLRPLVHV